MLNFPEVFLDHIRNIYKVQKFVLYLSEYCYIPNFVYKLKKKEFELQNILSMYVKGQLVTNEDISNQFQFICKMAIFP